MISSRRRIGHEDVFFVLMSLLGLWVATERMDWFGWVFLVFVFATCAFQLGKLRSERISWSNDVIEHRRWGKLVAAFPMDGSSSLFAREVPGPEPWILPVRSHGLFLLDTPSVRDETKFVRLYPSYYTRQDEWRRFLDDAVADGRLGARPAAVELLSRL